MALYEKKYKTSKLKAGLQEILPDVMRIEIFSRRDEERENGAKAKLYTLRTSSFEQRSHSLQLKFS